jgi:glycosyltransferase involved in cell wall biosynthesis
MISFIIPSHNNLKHLKNAVVSVQKHAPEAEIVLLDDGSTDGTWEWIQTQKCISYQSLDRVGHTILYDVGIQLATNEIVGILHADMIISPNYVENTIKHLKRKTVVCATRIEPPLHPPGNEKIIRNFGMDFNDLDITAFEEFCLQEQQNKSGVTSKGMFAPWVIYKQDFEEIGGHDPLFAPFPFEDSDLFQRWILNGYELIQSRDALVYHLTCRGHRWTEKVGRDDTYFQACSYRSGRNYLRKWGSWIQNDEWQYPIIKPKYHVTIFFSDHLLTERLLREVEPQCDELKIVATIKSAADIQQVIDTYIDSEQCNTLFDLSKKISVVEFNKPICNKGIAVQILSVAGGSSNLSIVDTVKMMLRDNKTSYIDTFSTTSFTIIDATEYQHNLIQIQ